MKFDIYSRRQSSYWNPKRLTNSGIEFDGRAFSPPAFSFLCVPSLINSDRPIDDSASIDDAASTEGELNAKTHKASDEMSEPRHDRVARLRQQVRSGTYEIPVPQLVRILADIILRRR